LKSQQADLCSPVSLRLLPKPAGAPAGDCHRGAAGLDHAGCQQLACAAQAPRDAAASRWLAASAR